MKKALITGITGQLGSYLAELLLEKGYEVYGTSRQKSDKVQLNFKDKVKLFSLDLENFGKLEEIIRLIDPDEIYNLAAQSDAQVSFNLPEYTFKTNGLAVLRICEAISSLHKPIKIFQANSAELYGGLYNGLVNEQTPFHPRNPYAISKLCAYWIINFYREKFNLFACNGIVFNSESPRRGENFVTKKIAKSVVDIVNGKLDFLKLGNLNARRDWSHAKDTSYAIWHIMQTEKSSDYIIASGGTHSVREFVELAFKEVGMEISWRGSGIHEEGYDKNTGRVYVKIDPTYFRPSEKNVSMSGDISKIKRDTNWQPQYKFEDIVKEMVEYDLKQTKERMYLKRILQ